MINRRTHTFKSPYRIVYSSIWRAFSSFLSNFLSGWINTYVNSHVGNNDIWMKGCLYTGLLVLLTFTFLVTFPGNLTESSMCTGLPQYLVMFSIFSSFEVTTFFIAKWVFFDIYLVTCVKLLKSKWYVPPLFFTQCF